jgi:histidine triad (HIT) family protein
MQAVPRLGQALLAVTGAAGFNVLVNQGRAAGQEVFHVHVHVIPRAADDGLGYRWNAGKYPPDAIEEWRRRYCDAL